MDVKINKLIIEYLDNTIKSDDRLYLESLMKDDVRVKKYFENVKSIWSSDAREKYDEIFDTEEKLNQIKGGKKRIFMTFMKYAAIFIGLLSISAVLFFYFKEDRVEYVYVSVPNGQKHKVNLPDSSIVWLNGGSSIKYAKEFSKEKRFVEFDGEAFFDVKKDKKRPFIIKTNSSEIEVLGTSFNVYDYKKDPNKVTTLLTGRISYSYADNQKVVIYPNQMITYNVNNRKINITEEESGKSVLWVDDYLYFNNEPMQKVINRIFNKYNVVLVFEDKSIQNTHFTATFDKNDNINKIADALTLILNQKHIFKNDTLKFVKK